jgi:hypothetical protein
MKVSVQTITRSRKPGLSAKRLKTGHAEDGPVSPPVGSSDSGRHREPCRVVRAGDRTGRVHWLVRLPFSVIRPPPCGALPGWERLLRRGTWHDPC